MYKIYLYEGVGDKIRGAAGEELVREAALSYLFDVAGMGKVTSEELAIERTEKGKPFFPMLKDKLQFNVSHSGLMWVCIMGPSACGIDIQEVKDCSFMKLAAKHYTRQEQSMVMRLGLDGFFDIWTRREAFGKYIGEGFFASEMPSFVDDDGKLVKKFERGGKPVYLHELKIAPYIKCVYCNEEETDEIEIIG